MRGYICATKEDHIARGFGTKVFGKDNLSKDILEGKSNMEALSPKVEREEISVELMNRTFRGWRMEGKRG